MSTSIELLKRLIKINKEALEMNTADDVFHDNFREGIITAYKARAGTYNRLLIEELENKLKEG